MTTAIYARVSTPGQQEDGTSLDTQVEGCRQLAAERGLDVPQELVFSEQASGADRVRPILTRILNMARDHEITALLVHSPDRLSRNPLHLMVVSEDLANDGVQLLFVQGPSGDSPEDKLVRYILGYVGEKERSLIAERTTRGKVAVAKNGRMPVGTGLGLYGYRYDKQTKKREVLDQEATTVRNIFLFDVQNDTTHLVSKNRGSSKGITWAPAISQDGNYVTFWSGGVFNVDNAEWGISCHQSGTAPLCNEVIFFYDRASASLSRLFPYPYGTKNDYEATMSADGRYVFFGSNKTDLDSSISDTNNDLDVYVKDRDSGTIRMAYPFVDSAQVVNFQISGDGRYLAVSAGGSVGCASDCPSTKYGGWNSDFGTGSSNDRTQIYLVDQQIGDVELVSNASDGSLGNDHSSICHSDRNGSYNICSSMSSDGRYITFTSKSTNLTSSLVDGDRWQIYVRDMLLGTTEVASLSSGGAIGNGDSQAASISGNGRYVVFESKATNLHGTDNSVHSDIYVHDRQTNTTDLVSRAYVWRHI